jgi:hypothetical protein
MTGCIFNKTVGGTINNNETDGIINGPIQNNVGCTISNIAGTYNISGLMTNAGILNSSGILIIATASILTNSGTIYVNSGGTLTIPVGAIVLNNGQIIRGDGAGGCGVGTISGTITGTPVVTGCP